MSNQITAEIAKSANTGFNESTTDRILTSCGFLYLTIVKTKDGKVKNLFAKLGKSGGCPASQLDGISYLAKLCIRAEVPIKKIVKGLKGIGCHAPCDTATSCSDAFVKILEGRLGDK